VIVVGDSELAAGIVELKRMSDGVISSVKIEELNTTLAEALSPTSLN
jgi:histidyl-tRNA synthetase